MSFSFFLLQSLFFDRSCQFKDISVPLRLLLKKSYYSFDHRFLEQVLCLFRVFCIGKFVEFYRVFVKERLARKVYRTTHVSSDDMCSGSSESRKMDALECMSQWLQPRKVMWLYMTHTGGEQIPGNETLNFRERGWESVKREVGDQAGEHKLFSLGQGPTMSPGGQGNVVM